MEISPLRSESTPSSETRISQDDILIIGSAPFEAKPDEHTYIVFSGFGYACSCGVIYHQDKVIDYRKESG